MRCAREVKYSQPLWYKAAMSRRVDFTVSMGKAQEGIWLLVISLSYPRQTLPNIDVQWPSRARDATTVWIRLTGGARPTLEPETNSSRQGDEGPWVWLAYRAERCLFSSHTFAPYFSTFVRRVHSQTFEGGIDAPRFLASE